MNITGGRVIEFDIEQMRELVRPGGGLSRILPGFCHRREQEDLLVRIAEALKQDEFLLAEAGTGVGKSLSYLIPAVFWAVSTGQKVLVATRTKALQNQLVTEDIPRLQEALPFKFCFAQAKGRENYLCWNKLAGFESRPGELSRDQQQFLRMVKAWAIRSSTGDREELTVDSRLLSYWPMVACDHRTCLRELCPHHETCFRQRLFKRMNRADLIVTNHSLLLTDARLGKGFFPEYQYLVIDEAHNLEREAFDKFGISLRLGEVREALHALLHKQRKGQAGYLAFLRERYPNLQEELDRAGKLKELYLGEMEGFFQTLSRCLRTAEEESGQVMRWSFQPERHSSVVDSFLASGGYADQLVEALQELGDKLEEREAVELGYHVERVRDIINGASEIMTGALEDPEQVVWLDILHGQAVAVTASPLRVGEGLARYLYEGLKSLVMVSATLTVAGDFSYFIDRTGLNNYKAQERLSVIARQSPFDYERCRFFLINDLPEPNLREFQPRVTWFLEDFLSTIPGRTLVLFTSRRMLRETAGALRAVLSDRGITLLVQYQDGDFSTLVERLVSSERAVLMGVDTFWEGVDLRGDNLTCLVMVRMPFRSPSDPLTSAWSEYYQDSGESSFFRYMLPDAVLRFKQGIGRLIRSESDWGAAVILDGRLAPAPRGKNYGQLFIRSLPGRIVEVNAAAAGGEVARWLESFVNT